MTKDEALRLAWDALEDIGDEWGFTSQRTVPKRKEAITAIKEALAQPEHGWTPERIAGMARLKEAQDKKLAQPEQEPVVCDCDSPSWCKQYKKCNRKMLGFMPYVAQPQRTWVGLTDKDWNRSKHNYDFQKGVDWAESILKEKNT